MSVNLTGWARRQPLSTPARAVLVALAEGAETVAEVAASAGLPEVAVIDAFAEIGAAMTVIWKRRRPYFRLGQVGYFDREGNALDDAQP